MIENLIARIRNELPSKPAMAALLASFVLGAVVSTGKLSCQPVPDRPAPLAPLSPQGLVRLGKTYTVNLGKVYASAWETGAASLDAGKPVSEALGSVRAAWDQDRGRLFNRFISIEFDKIVPQGKADADVTAAERAELSKAWRSFAAGLRR
jgi:hypothetical protein